MFNMHDFVIKTIIGMVGKEPEYKVRQYALGWLEKDVLTEEDLAVVETRFAELAAQTADEVMEA
ncbi:MAG: hypothetical protein IKM36_06250 [Oscillospiraceae bacterium]|nr:hypothetical protein [Oscillospiraceae bacterium]MBR2977214.1 hypothetical protein [Oscillospiraceae bacterium]MBR3850071.1 hypothetical protein [Oscillospiraceae bacterium]